jgi:hypothetical protein
MANEQHNEHPAEMPAVRTTIVGGRPPGCGKSVGTIPRGIEILIKKAAVDPGFKALLLERRSQAAAAIDLRLEPAEVAMLDSVPAAQLEAIIAGTKVPDNAKPILAGLGKVAGVTLAALGLAGLASSGCDRRPDGAQTSGNPQVAPSDHNAPQATQSSDPPYYRPEPGQAKGIRPDRPQSRGIQPDRPRSQEGQP